MDSFNQLENIVKIGQGGFSTVYYARWYDKSQGIDHPIALKLIHDSKKNSERFKKEKHIAILVLKTQHF